MKLKDAMTQLSLEQSRGMITTITTTMVAWTVNKWRQRVWSSTDERHDNKIGIEQSGRNKKLVALLKCSSLLLVDRKYLKRPGARKMFTIFFSLTQDSFCDLLSLCLLLVTLSEDPLDPLHLYKEEDDRQILRPSFSVWKAFEKLKTFFLEKKTLLLHNFFPILATLKTFWFFAKETS